MARQVLYDIVLTGNYSFDIVFFKAASVTGRTWAYGWNAAGGSWTLDQDNGLSATTRKESVSGLDRIASEDSPWLDGAAGSAMASVKSIWYDYDPVDIAFKKNILGLNNSML